MNGVLGKIDFNSLHYQETQKVIYENKFCQIEEMLYRKEIALRKIKVFCDIKKTKIEKFNTKMVLKKTPKKILQVRSQK